MILLLNARGDIAAAIASGIQREGEEAHLDTKTNVSSMAEVRAVALELRPRAIVVRDLFEDRLACESDPDRAFVENSESLIHVAAAALQIQAVPVLLSPPEVFGQRGGPFSESDEPIPRSTYATTRLQGERFLFRASKSALVVRAGPLLAPGLSAERALFASGSVRVSPNEHLTPLSAEVVGQSLVKLLACGTKGVVHLAGQAVEAVEFFLAIATALGLPDQAVERASSRLDGAVWAGGPALFGDKANALLSGPLEGWRTSLASFFASDRQPKVEISGPAEGQLAAPVEELNRSMGHPQEVKRVEKPWGYEIIWAHSDRYVGKVLFVRSGERLSLQYHERKDETVYVLSGKMVFEVGPKDGPREDRIMKGGDSYRITPFTVHRMIALEDTQILEASTPELDDVVRLEDKYGRQGTSVA